MKSTSACHNPIHRRYQYAPAGELVRTLDKLRGEIKYEYEANGQLRSRDTGSLIGSEEFRYDRQPTAWTSMRGSSTRSRTTGSNSGGIRSTATTRGAT
ncbi:TPA: hypothetical protein QEM50_005360 [Pseudomonas putida]|nr:hypothetical protein [Pseudomonas putida]